MQTVVVALKDVNNSDQLRTCSFNDIFNIYGKEVRVIIHDSPTFDSDGLKFIPNFDILIDSTLQTGLDLPNYLNSLDAYTRFRLKRECKSVMRNKLNTLCSDVILPIKFWKSNKDNSGKPYHFGNNFSGNVVIKPEWGARGLGQIVIDTLKHSPSEILADLRDMGFDKFSDKYPEITVTRQRETDINEAKNLATGDVYLEELVRDIDKEFRVLVSPNKTMFFKRTRTEADYPQATGAGIGMHKPCIDVNQGEFVIEQSRDVSAKLLAATESIRNNLNFHYGSIDLYTTRKGDVGCFEYSTQFATNGVDPSHAKIIHDDLIKSLVEKYLKD